MDKGHTLKITELSHFFKLIVILISIENCGRCDKIREDILKQE